MKRLTCPTCDTVHSEPGIALASWTDNCCCSDLTRCVAHQTDATDAPVRPSSEVMAARNSDALAAARKRFAAKADRIERARRQQDLTAEDVEALRWARGQMRVIQLHGEQPAVGYAAKAGAVLDRIIAKGVDRGE